MTVVTTEDPWRIGESRDDDGAGHSGEKLAWLPLGQVEARDLKRTYPVLVADGDQNLRRLHQGLRHARKIVAPHPLTSGFGAEDLDGYVPTAISELQASPDEIDVPTALHDVRVGTRDVELPVLRLWAEAMKQSLEGWIHVTPIEGPAPGLTYGMECVIAPSLVKNGKEYIGANGATSLSNLLKCGS